MSITRDEMVMMGKDLDSAQIPDELGGVSQDLISALEIEHLVPHPIHFLLTNVYLRHRAI